jgi:ABC-type multidrug transport system ATPase subunit
MRIPNFEIRNQRSIRLAKCESVPRLMVVAGPNGAGKSTLLNAVRSSTDGYTNVMYVGPHRALRKQNVQQRHLFVSPISFETLLSNPNVQNFEGIRIFDGVRDPWSGDDSGNYLKHALCQIEIDRQQAITAKADRDGEIARGSLPDTWKPLRELAQSLLPHLAFARIDASNRSDVKVLWRVHKSDTVVDLDDLSSGEKSIIQMFYPLVERDIKALVKEIESGPQEPADRAEFCVLIDEPELHLHPNLQLKVLDYLRVLASPEKKMQAILATHSATVVEAASFEELFLLRPAELVNAGDNQLAQVATDEERLTFLREAFGSTSNLTALQPVIVVEGAREKDTKKVVSDRKLYRALHPGFDGVTLISGGGKSEAMALRRVLQDALVTFALNLRVVALLDRDMYTGSPGDGVELLPVAMIENFLLDSDAIWEAIQSIVEKTRFSTVDDVVIALDDIANSIERDELGRRTAAALGSSHFHPPTDIARIESAVAAYIAEVGARYGTSDIEATRGLAQEYIAKLRSENRRREEFHGKSLLDAFYRMHLSQTGLAKVVFTFEAARHARRRKSVVSFFDALFARIAPGVSGLTSG